MLKTRERSKLLSRAGFYCSKLQ